MSDEQANAPEQGQGFFDRRTLLSRGAVSGGVLATGLFWAPAAGVTATKAPAPHCAQILHQLKAEIAAAPVTPKLRRQLKGEVGDAIQKMLKVCDDLESMIQIVDKNTGPKGIPAGVANHWINLAELAQAQLGLTGECFTASGGTF